MGHKLFILLILFDIGLNAVNTGLPLGNGLFARASRFQLTPLHLPVPSDTNTIDFTSQTDTFENFKVEPLAFQSASQTAGSSSQISDLSVSSQSHQSQSTQQYFVVRPRDIKTAQGENVLLECQVGNRRGLVQWSKDGFLLGYQTSIPGFPGHSMDIDEARGVYNLVIRNVQMADEGVYQCQVGPASNGVTPIRAEANLHVILPPVRLDINGSRGPEVVFAVRANTRVVLTCTAKKARPAARIRWFRKSVELVPEAARTLTIEETERRVTTVSSITLWPSQSVLNDQYTCEALHPALQPNGSGSGNTNTAGKHMKITALVRVMTAPNSTRIEGYIEGTPVREGDVLNLVCRSRGGNPPPNLLWLRDGISLPPEIITQRTKGNRISESTLDLELRATDHGAEIQCRPELSVSGQSSSPQVSSVGSPYNGTGLEASVRLTVYFAPRKVLISGTSEVRRGSEANLHCAASPSNPAVTLEWTIDGIPVEAEPRTALVTQMDKGYIASSNLTIQTDPSSERTVRIIDCHARSKDLKGSPYGRHRLNVTFSPDRPQIIGYKEGQIARHMSSVTLTCLCKGGNPFAELRWLKDSEPIPTKDLTILTDGVQSAITFSADRSDNGATYSCEAFNPATATPLVAKVKLQVRFPPEYVNVTVDPPMARVGQRVSLLCNVSSSLPVSTIRWFRGPSEIDPDYQQVNQPASFGGTSSHSRLTLLSVTAEDNDLPIVCSAFNHLLNISQMSKVHLRVAYPPEFPQSEWTFKLTEGESMVVNISAKANPSVTTKGYSWTRRGALLTNVDALNDSAHSISFDGPLLHLRNVTRFHAGHYLVEADNGEGVPVNASVYLNVLFAPILENVTRDVEVDEGQDAVLFCSAVANPSAQELFSWRRQGAQLGLAPKTKLIQKTTSSELRLLNVSRNATGIFECVATNGVGEAAVGIIRLTVNYRPRIQMPPDPPLHRVASAVEDSVEISCKADGVPAVNFEWLFNGQPISAMHPNFELPRPRKLADTRWEGLLTIRKVTEGDYGLYSCVANNSLGTDSLEFHLVPKSAPDPPMGLQAFNISHHAVRLSWQPGFDGGHLQTFYITYRKTDVRATHPVTVSPRIAEDDSERKTNVKTVADIQQRDTVLLKQSVLAVNLTSSQSSLIVEGLEANTEYTFEVTSSNILGKSRAPSEPLEVITQNIPQMDSTISMAGNGGPLSSSGLGSGVGFHQSASSTLYALVAAVAGLLLCVNICLLGVFLRRRRRNNDSQANGDCNRSSASGKKPSNDKKVFLVGERKGLAEKDAPAKGAAGYTRDNDDHWIQTPPKLDFHVFRTPDDEPVAKQVALHQETLEQEVKVMPPQLAVADGYKLHSRFDTSVPLTEVPFPDVLPLPRTLLSGSSSIVAQPTLSASGQLPSEVAIPQPLSATDGIFLPHQQLPPPPMWLPPIRDVFDPTTRRYSTAANEPPTAVQRDDLVSSTLPRNLHLHQTAGLQQQRTNQQQLQQQQPQQILPQQQQPQLANQQVQSANTTASSSRNYGGAATLGRQPRNRQTTTQRPGVRWIPAVQMIPPVAASVTACNPTSQGLKETS
ncbi:nephrin-like isoform X2 [Varroa destructor]|uniref:Nephrin n=1 Tax=Varroa destructor TaxID=109461 RepID=A0A7M7KAF8_VARDE|nr:nephrin-like isoform X2 [Varroa destructor]